MDPTLKLLTLINVSAARPGKRQRTGNLTHYDKITSKAASASAAVASSSSSSESTAAASASPSKKAKAGSNGASAGDALVGEDSDDDDNDFAVDPKTRKGSAGSAASSSKKPLTAFDAHFGSDGPHASAIAKLPESVDKLSWTNSRVSAPSLSADLIVSTPELSDTEAAKTSYTGNPHQKVLEAFNAYILKKKGNDNAGPSKLHNTLAGQLGSYADLVHSGVNVTDRTAYRETIAMHAMSHVTKTRRRVLKNNEKLAKLSSSSSSANVNEDALGQEIRDQGFTRPKVLVLLPFRNSAVEWVDLLSKFSLCAQVDNKSRFEKEYHLPEGAIDKLADPEVAARYSKDHIETFKGNIDDSFRMGIKVTRKSLKLYSPFYDSDVIVASPLGLRLGIEKEKGDADFLSSIEMLVVDQTDVISMQNWEHLQFVFERLNQIPKQSRDTDFSRVKQWYLDNRARFFRQSILLSSYDFPQLRALYNHSLQNLAGKARSVIPVPDANSGLSQSTAGMRHTFVRFESANLLSEPDHRLQHFTTKTLATLSKSAMSASHTLIVVPSYFDFVRLDDFFRKANESRTSASTQDLSYTSISEYSRPKEITRAREAFFTGRKRFLLLTERAHFYRRFKLRGVKTIVFYQLPQNPAFFPEIEAFPFTSKSNLRTSSNKNKNSKHADFDEDDEEVDPNDVQSHILYSKYDLLQLEHVVGSEQAKDMVTATKATWKFV
ncbi:DUF1253-domain-containing protein [Testicularia cyperi]|uniref:U3 small nucleolar RNA-associated protein 25 n=1 Tax=Testicularia cyperi TaxID=1882483 RepID=A0A317XFT1_9BASI|nr:DUF1253-domain-containing protein [Testicularia cyperi]